MAFKPDYDRFAKAWEAGKPVAVHQELVADLDTPVSAWLKLANHEPYSFLLESVEGGEQVGRYSIIGLAPDLVWKVEDGLASRCTNPFDSNPTYMPDTATPLDSLRDLLTESMIDMPYDLPPMAAGIVGYMGYDMVREMERLQTDKPDPLNLPAALFIRPTLMAIFDSVKNQITVVTPARPDGLTSAKQAWLAAEARIETMVSRIEGALPNSYAPIYKPNPEPPAPQSNTLRSKFHKMVKAAQDYILAGDIFQVVLSQRFSQKFPLPAFALYRALRRKNPSPFMYHLSFPGFAVVGSSPEILVRLRDGEVTLRPIAGTRKRGATPSEDIALEKDLLSDPKELSEHLMLLDLGRNDVGRVSKPGTVKVTDDHAVERYSHVMHIVSNVVGQLDDQYDAIDALKAGFPAGTVSGAPKIRAMEIIDELESEARGPYAGSVGYFSADGSMDTCIVLRTAIVKDGVMHVQAGAGVVADSDPEMEMQECENKAQALFAAAVEAERFAKSNRG